MGTPLTVEWEPWLKVMGLQEVRTKNTLRFTSYADSISAAVAGQGVAIGRFPLLDDMLRDKRLVAPLQGCRRFTPWLLLSHGHTCRHQPRCARFCSMAAGRGEAG